jgi:transposase InsO family protein
LAITDYFTKWVEAIPLKSVASKDVINFVKEHVIHRFGIPQTITTDGGSVFISEEFQRFTTDMGIKLIRSSPYYAQANAQAEESNQSLIKLIKRKIDEHSRHWHDVLSEALWEQQKLHLITCVWTGGYVTVGDYGQLKTRRVPK